MREERERREIGERGETQRKDVNRERDRKWERGSR